MPYKLIPPKAGRSSFWRIRGTEFGTYLDRSTQTGDRREAARFLKFWRDEAERVALSGPVKVEAMFGLAAVAYMNSGRDKQFLPPLIEHFKDKPLAEIDQAALNAAAVALYPRGSDATRNRQVYSPVSAILKHAGVRKAFQRPKGARSTPRLHWLREDQAWPLIEAASARHARFGAFLTFLLYCGPRTQRGDAPHMGRCRTRAARRVPAADQERESDRAEPAPDRDCSLGEPGGATRVPAPNPRGRRPSIAATTMGGATKASDSVMRIERSLLPSLSAINSMV